MSSFGGMWCPQYVFEAQIANSICPLIISNISRVCLLNILEEPQPTNVAYGFIWVIRPLHFVGVRKVSHLLPAIPYASLGGREAIWATVEMILEFMVPGFICEHIIHAVNFQVYRDLWSVNEAC